MSPLVYSTGISCTIMRGFCLVIVLISRPASSSAEQRLRFSTLHESPAMVTVLLELI